uniref:Uncharacterized protein n=1 Tax=Rhizophagus irregularis (strain DAOM 181602 / DAOM 197198 / MUCL 43194) TaxID=747089 RepID=U9TIB7_RHIID
MFIHSSGTLWDLYVYIIAELVYSRIWCNRFINFHRTFMRKMRNEKMMKRRMEVERGMKIMMEDERMNENNGKEPKDNKKNDEGLH